jgi:hypothetical protein
MYNPSLVSIGILDYDRPVEAELLMTSLKNFAHFDYELVYLSNGGDQSYIKNLHKINRIDKLILNDKNTGCGLATRQLFQSCMTEWLIYVQVDQFLGASLHQEDIDYFIKILNDNPKYFYMDMAGNQGQGNASERAMLINRNRYLSMPGLDKIIGGPGPYANYQWTENFLQEYMKKENLTFFPGFYFGNNGKVSKRTYPCGAETIHFTDERRLFILKPFHRRYDDFPNLKLNDEEWKMALEETFSWPEEGMIPEADKKDSFIYWPETFKA